MTTIAYRDGLLAADTQMFTGGTLMGQMHKIARREDGAMAGAAGDAAFNAMFTKWFVAGEQGPAPEAKESEHAFDRGIIFRPNGRIDVFEPRGAFQVTGEYFAFGSGRDYALGALFAGSDARDAVAAAIKHDPHTGGEITVLNHAGRV